MDWPKHYPKACPPVDSTNIEGKIFRIITGTNPAEKDFKSHWEISPSRREEWMKDGKACESCGLSVLITLEDAKRLLDVFPKLGKKIAMAELDSKFGKIKKTTKDKSGNHHTWWIPLSVVRPWESFKVVA